VAPARVKVLSGKKLALVAILRAGLVMVEGILKLVPHARVGHIGLYRDPESLKPSSTTPSSHPTSPKGGSSSWTPCWPPGEAPATPSPLLKEKGATGIKLMCIIAAPEGLERIARDHPDTEVVVAAIDERLNQHGYIVPGLGRCRGPHLRDQMSEVLKRIGVAEPTGGGWLTVVFVFLVALFFTWRFIPMCAASPSRWAGPTCPTSGA
jgi:uracil phosphoribosyltransferase